MASAAERREEIFINFKLALEEIVNLVQWVKNDRPPNLAEIMAKSRWGGAV